MLNNGYEVIVYQGEFVRELERETKREMYRDSREGFFMGYCYFEYDNEDLLLGDLKR